MDQAANATAYRISDRAVLWVEDMLGDESEWGLVLDDPEIALAADEVAAGDAFLLARGVNPDVLRRDYTNKASAQRAARRIRAALQAAE